MARKSVSESYAEMEEAEVLRLANNVADEALEKLQLCRQLLKQGILPLSVDDTGQRELMLLNCLVVTAGRIRHNIIAPAKKKNRRRID